MSRACGALLTAAAVLLGASLLGASARASSVEDRPSPFVRSSSRDGFTSLETRSLTYRRSDGTGALVTLVGVVHIGDESYYDQLVSLLDTHELVLYESVLPRGAFGASGVDDAARQRSTQDSMLFVRSVLANHVRVTGALPESLGALRAFSASKDSRTARSLDLASVDGWGASLAYERAGPMAYRLVSLGSDGRSGGRDHAMDLVLQSFPASDELEFGEPKDSAAKDRRRDLYSELAEALDTGLQVRTINYDRATWVPADLPIEELLDRLWARGERSSTLEFLSREDGFQQGMIRFLLSLVSKSPSFKKLVIEALGSSGAASGRGGKSMGLGSVDQRLILTERNDAVLDQLRMRLQAPNAPHSIAIFYGAAHMAEFEASLRAELKLIPGAAATDSHWFCAMAAEEWSAKKIRARITALEAERAKGIAADPLGAYPACERIESLIAQLQARLARLDSPPPHPQGGKS